MTCQLLRGMSYMALVCVSCTLVSGQSDFPWAFPDSVARATSNIANIQTVSHQRQSDQSSVLNGLMERGSAMLEQDLIDDAALSDLKQATYKKVHQRVLKHIYIGGCPRTYLGCPAGWAEEKGTCSPPSNYNGLCGSLDLASFKERSLQSKEDLAWKCQMSWPCLGACLKGFHTCPKHWVHLGNSLCIAPETYTGMCSPATDFSMLSLNQKAAWASQCDSTWPCLNDVVVSHRRNQTRDGPVL